MNRAVLLCLLTVTLETASAQTNLTDQKFAISFSAGTAFSQPSSWFFYSGPRNVLVRLGFSSDVGLVYGPIKVSDLALLFLSSEFGFSQAQTAEQDFGRGTVLVKWQRIPIMAWAKLTTQSSFSPYVRAGLGGMKVKFDEVHSAIPSWDISLDYWALAWGVGAGLDWVASDNFRVSFFVDYLSGEGTRTQSRSNGSVDGLYLRTVVVPVGFRGTITI